MQNVCVWAFFLIKCCINPQRHWWPKQTNNCGSRCCAHLEDANTYLGFRGHSVGKNPPANAGDANSVHGLGRSPGGRNGNLFQHSCLKKPMGRGAWQAPKESDTTWQLNHHHHQNNLSSWIWIVCHTNILRPNKNYLMELRGLGTQLEARGWS